ncbi:MAG: hypothetical protein J6K52_01840 [Clostridia bacterium]|nr:hypothetical protein [Clostridia bacterium]
MEDNMKLQDEDLNAPKGDLYPPELKFICRLCYIASNKRMVDKVECARVERTGMYCRAIEKLRAAYAIQEKEINFAKRYVSLFMGCRNVFSRLELKDFYDKTADKTVHNFEEFLDFCRLYGIDVVE